MSDFNDILNIIHESSEDKITQKTVHEKQIESNDNLITEVCDALPFDIQLFSSELYQKSIEKNKEYILNSTNISGHDIADGCILSIINKICNVPVENYADKWLPIFMRSVIGSAIHDFIQCNSNQFTETEVSIKIPSIRFSGRIDCLIQNKILVEIKSCTYKDYDKIIKSQRPRTEDFYQTMAYKYILENHLKEAQDLNIETRSPKPKYENYQIEKIQFIYIAHDIVAADVENMAQALMLVKNVKKLLSSNKFNFIHSLVLDVNSFDPTPYMTYVENKIKTINWYLDNNKFPDSSDPYINPKACFFCLYSNQCNCK